VADYVTVANLALSKLGEDDQIRDPDQDSHAARSVRAVWGSIRRATLVVFIRDVVEVGNWDDLFVEAFAAHLAFQIADRITGDRGRKSDCWGEYRKRVKDAAGVDAKEDPPENAYESSWVTARGSSSLGGPPNV
jgi:hypothetical protein